MPKAFVTGITGQDGSYLAELLLGKGYEVHGLVRSMSIQRQDRTDFSGVQLHLGDLSDGSTLQRLVKEIQPDEIYHLGALSNVKFSFDNPELTLSITGASTQHLLQAVHRYSPHSRFYQASTSELFGNSKISPQNENTPFKPRSPYGCAKLYAHSITVNYRESYNLHASCGILFNHESPRRGESFVTRKITRTLAKILAGKEQSLALGNLDSKRDWGYAKDYVEAMWLITQQPKPDDFVIATGKTHSIKDFLTLAFSLVGLDWTKYVVQDPAFTRPAEVDLLIGDGSKAKKILNWEPKVQFEELVRMMVTEDLALEGLSLPQVKSTQPARKFKRVA